MDAITNNTITIVTGLPRSGTSMMMKMLEAGGVPPLCDGLRTADSDNPNGYYEFEPVKNTKDDPSWLKDAPGNAVKMVYSLLYDLPSDGWPGLERGTSETPDSADRDSPGASGDIPNVDSETPGLPSRAQSSPGHPVTYNVLFMRRELSEILASQRRMLANMNIESPVDDDRMGRLFEKEITRFSEWVASAAHINCIEIPYNDVASGSVTPLHQINSHLGGGLNVDAMSAVVDPSLYRNRAAA